MVLFERLFVVVSFVFPILHFFFSLLPSVDLVLDEFNFVLDVVDGPYLIGCILMLIESVIELTIVHRIILILKEFEN
jgi:hypothetical protein